ncbi:hypothetical protein WQ53_08515 [Pseudoxanthomonas suwonensis]|uniref:eCIS core domain-containing protein n=1 Tax=Pseudoxanthomonas suwonensis TaxID=314722 RepID=A0A0E3Z1T1_9GAMM|nr:hypothetical protein WQ53_08515 [Pseudoxanthomonas suwonensis]
MVHARIHADAPAAAAAQALRARAFAAGEHLFFDTGRYAPHTPHGERLLLHELVHVEQLAWSPHGLLVLRDGEEDAAAPTAPSPTVMAVTLDGVDFYFGNRRYSAGSTRAQIWPLVLQRLLGTQHDPSRDASVLESWLQHGASQNLRLINDLRVDRAATAGEVMIGLSLSAQAVLMLIEVLEAPPYRWHADLSEEQRELLRVGYALMSAWPLLRPRLPRWYDENMFRRQMAQRGSLARDWQRMAPTTPGHEEYSAENREAMIESIFAALTGPVRIVEAIRLDYRLGDAAGTTGRGLRERYRAQGAVAYRGLWRIDAPLTARLTEAPPEDRVRNEIALWLLGYVHTQPDLSAAATLEGTAGHEARLELLGRLFRYLDRTIGRITRGDESLFNVPARATDPPWDARMTSAPPLTPPLYDAALRTDHAFTMQLEFGDVFDAFADYGYLWKFVRIPDPESGEEVPDPLTAAGTRPDFGTVFDTRVARARRYNAADLERVRSRFGTTPWGRAISNASFAADLVRLNNVLRTLGTVIRTVLERLTQPRYTTRIVFPRPGMYVVVCRAVPVLAGDEEVTHAPSVAMLPVVARDPDEMAITRVRESSRNEFQVRLRLAEIRALLDSPLPPENAAELQAEMEELQAMLAAPGEALVARRELLRSQVALLRRRLELRRRIAAAETAEPADPGALAALRRELFDAGGETSSAWAEREDVRGLERQLETLGEMIDMREERIRGERGVRFTPHATFVSDLGHSLALSLEMYDRGVVGGAYQVYISDLTTPDSGATLGSSPLNGLPNPRVAAVLAGLRDLLEDHSDYGRGRVAVQLEGALHTLRVEAGTGRMLMEAVENGVTVLSLAAIVAAPFTAGESLMLLLPLGAVGAVPSAYRLYQRYDEHRLRFDLATAMDVVNLVGGAIGLAHAATPLRMVRMGRVMMVAGLGADGAGMLMMGAGLVQQIEALRHLPEHERAAQLLMILGGAMMQIGIQAGGMVMHSRYQGARESAAPRREGADPRLEAGDAPGFRPPREGSSPPRADATPPGPADRSTSAAAPPPRAPPAPPRASTRRTRRHDRLMARFEGGIDYSRPPPAADVANPPRAGECQRRLRTDEAAFNAYNDAVAASAGREVGLFHNPRTGEYRVMIGDETGVSAPGRSGWDAVVHYHPDGSTRSTFRLPSPHDFQGLMFRYLEGGGPVREFVEFDIPGVGRGRTEYGIDPGHAEPFYVRIHRPGEPPQTLRFAHDGAFRTYWGERTVFVEPGSPLYQSMIRDIQGYVRSLDPAQAGAAPARRTEAGGDAGAARPTPGAADAAGPGPAADSPRRAGEGGEGRPAPGDRTAAASEPTSSGRFTDDAGGLTDAGIAFIRRRFRTVSEFGGGRSRRVALDNLSDAQIRNRFSTESAWLEAVVIGEVRQSWIGRTSATDFLLDNPQQTLRNVATRLAAAIEAGGTGHTLNEGVLGRNALDFVRERVAANDPVLRPAWDALESSTNPAVQRAWNRFLFGTERMPGATPAARQRHRQALMDAPGGSGEGFGAGLVGNKRPDVIEVLLSRDAIHVLDPSQRWADPVHNFKTAFYEAVLRQLIDVGNVTSADTGGGARVRPTGL